ncbi:MAG TPA: carboxylesterase family protein [Mycobacteriales bacterium]|nr:carboxylesterase family protein [Mycobacteriales bacterium]
MRNRTGWPGRRAGRVALVAAMTCAAVTGAMTGVASAGGPGPEHGPGHGPGGSGRVVSTDRGAVRGTVATGMREFLGIPYAAAPVGNLRWRPPQPHARWSGVRDATRFAPHCAQPATPFGAASTSEDCLFLNVFAPAGRTAHRSGHTPVMVWIHGGALVTGESDDYDPSRLVAQGTVVVTINYRLGALGFLAHPALSAETADGASGDYGLMDQQAALRWVQRNIDRFGGDRHNVTIFGESAGGLSVHSQLASPLAAGLFDKAIVESGAYNLAQDSLATAQSQGSDFATRAGCAAQTAACLRALPVSTILANEGTGYTPDVDGRVLPRTVLDALSTGQFNRVPVVEGSNHDEWRLFVAQTELTTGAPLTAAGYPAAIAATLGVPLPVATAIAGQYPLSAFPSPSLALSTLGTDAIFACSSRASAQLLSRWVPTFQYEFADENAPMLFLPPVSFPTGAYHASELQYLFTLPAGVPNPGLDADQRRLSRAMVASWTHFARTGTPSVRGDVWPRFGTSDRFTALRPPTPAPGTGFAGDHQCAFWGAP